MAVEKDASDEGNVSFVNKRLNNLLNNTRIRDGTSYLCDKPMPSNVGISISVLPTLLEDITNEVDKWGNGGKNGRIAPFTEIYDVSFFLLCFLGSVPSSYPSARLHHDCTHDHLS